MPIASGTSIPPAGGPIMSRTGFYTMLGGGSSTSAVLGIGTLRAAPMYVPKRVTIDRIGAEITSGGDPGSKLRLGIYSDNGNIYPGALLLDAGTIAGDVVAVAEITISQVLEPGVYWLAGVVQIVNVVQPTVRTALEIPFCPIASANSAIQGDQFGVGHFGVSGVLPATFTTTIGHLGVMPRIFVRTV